MSLFSLAIPSALHSESQTLDDRISAFFGATSFKLAQDWSSAIQACLLVSEVGPGDEVILPALAPASLAHAVALVGAKPIFVDVEADSLLVSHRAIERALTERTKAVVVCHLYGQIFDSAPLYASLKPLGITLIEDGSDAFLSLASFGKGEGVRNREAARSCDFLVTCPPLAREAESSMPAFILSSHDDYLARMGRWAQPQEANGWFDPHQDGRRLIGILEEPDETMAQALFAFLDDVPSQQARVERQIQAYQAAFRQAPLRLLKPRKAKTLGQTAMPVHVPAPLRDELFALLRDAGFGVFVTYRSLPDLASFQNRFDSPACPKASQWSRGAFSLPTGSLITHYEQSLLIKQIEMEILPSIIDQLFQ